MMLCPPSSLPAPLTASLWHRWSQLARSRPDPQGWSCWPGETKHRNRRISSWGITARTELQSHCREDQWQSEGHVSVTHLLCGKVGFCVMLLLSKDNCKHSMRAAAGFIHVGGCHSPTIWTDMSMVKKGQSPAGLNAAAEEWEQEAAQVTCCPGSKTQPHLISLSNPFTSSLLNYSHLHHSLNRAFSICVLSSPSYMQTPRNTWAAFMWVFLTHCQMQPTADMETTNNEPETEAGMPTLVLTT